MCHTRESRPCRAQTIADQVARWQAGQISTEVLQWTCDLFTVQANVIALRVNRNTPRDQVVRIIREEVLPLVKGGGK